MKALLWIALASLCGCATCREHPTACKAVVAVVVIGTVISLDHHRTENATIIPRHGPMCRPGTEICQ